MKSILAADFEAHPEVKVSFENELDSQPIKRAGSEVLLEWKFADQIFCTSSFTAASLQQQGCDIHKLHVVPYGSFPLSKPNFDLHTKPNRCQFVFVGQGVQRKGLHHLLKAWRAARMNECDLTVICRRLDPGNAPLLDQPNLHYYNGVSDFERDKIYQASDVFVMPSLVEGFGLVYLEALSAGLYCIGTFNTGLPDLKPPHNIARIIAAGDLQQLTRIMQPFNLFCVSATICEQYFPALPI